MQIKRCSSIQSCTFTVEQSCSSFHCPISLLWTRIEINVKCVSDWKTARLRHHNGWGGGEYQRGGKFPIFPIRGSHKRKRFFGKVLPILWTHPRVFVRFGNTKGEIRVKKGDFPVIWIFLGVWTLSLLENHIWITFGKTLPKKAFFGTFPNTKAWFTRSGYRIFFWKLRNNKFSSVKCGSWRKRVGQSADWRWTAEVHCGKYRREEGEA